MIKCSPTTILKNSFIFFMLLVIPAITLVYSQVAINKPAIGFTQLCANPGFNTFEVSFSFSPAGSLNPTNQFILEMSDGSGNFASPIILSYTEKLLAATPTSRTLIFSAPTTTSGENYRLRVKSTSPVAVSPTTNAFAAYYKIQDSQFSINNFSPTATFCTGGSLILSIDNPGTGTNDSPLKYPSLKYNWFRVPSLVPIATTQTLTVTQPGRYYVETNYGTCTSDSYSNRVDVNEAAGGATASITSSKGNPFCASAGATILATQAGNSYQWFKNSVVIAGATSQQYQTSEGGLYTVRVDFGGCNATATLQLEDVNFNSSLNVSATTTINKGESKAVIVTTNAINPTFQWFLNNTLISAAVTNTLNINNEGKYAVIISQSTSCVSQKELLFEINYPFIDPNVTLIPNLVSPNNDGINDTWVLPQEYVSGTNTQIILLNSRGEVALQTNSYQNNWPENEINFNSINPIYYYIITTEDNKVKKGSITVVR
ncbi:gliding motility-associated C-terminal domain-containing protein [Flavobacterium micromati]|jgi:gliding motility-associated-like protein|uniref:Gliding motility-associated C-terminal domain-containing protein n=1 Tax=Flavobacterium micromati TaxID=229205 RepID=A0A1M5KTY8_9FLAO|nr:gliding motility-associated C-terminal domain-containing protein [Flavobacterium micromati]SHG56205.1 gliding motility-associated C-terminal domain-containing protein [Flavobacterium micromati]